MDNSKPVLALSVPKLAWITWGLAALFYYYEYSLQVSPSVMASQLSVSFHVQASGLGKLVAYYFYAYALMQIPVGLLLDKFGPRIMLTLALMICSAGSFILSRTTQLSTAECARFFMGMGSAFSVISCFKLAANWFPPRRFALLTGLLLTIGMLGAAGGEAPLALLVTLSGWRSVLVGFAVIGFILGVIIFIVVRDHPPDASDEAQTPPERLSTVIIALGSIIKKPQIWIAAVYGSLMFGPTIAFGGLWAVPYLTRQFAINKSTAGAIMTLFFIGWAIGATTFGAYSDAIQRRKPPLCIGAIGSLIFICIMLYLPVNIPWVMVCLFLFGFFSAAFLPIFSIVKEITPHQYAASALGFTNTLNVAVGALLQPTIGFILDMFWQGGMLHHGQRYYTPHLYMIALSVLPVCILLALCFFAIYLKRRIVVRLSLSHNLTMAMILI